MKKTRKDCGSCGKAVRDRANGIECDRCEVWYHAGCQKISLELYKVLQKYDEEWYCRSCHAQIKQMDNNIKQLVEENKGLKDRVKALEEKWDLFKEELKEETVKCAVQRISQDMGKHMEELEERNRRRNNLVLYNVPESTKEEAKERQSDDLVACCDLIEGSLKVTDFNIETTIRMGKSEDGKKRPLLVKLTKETDKKHILASAKNLKHETNPWKKRVDISSDMTKMEREQHQRLR